MLALTYLALCGRLTLGITFAASSVAKLVSFRGFRAAVEEFRLLPARLVGPFAGLVVLAELAAAIFLLSGTAVELGLVVAVALLIAFTIALVRVLRRGQSVACRCFGQLSAGPVTWTTVARNGVLAAVGGVGLVAHAGAAGVTPSTAEQVGAGLVVLGGFAVLAVGVEAARYAHRLSTLTEPGGE